VVTGPKFQQYFSDQDIQKLLRAFDNHAIIIKTKSNIDICRDFKDNFLLNLAIDSKADFLVTGDNDLLDIAQIEKTKILTIRELKDKLK